MIVDKKIERSNESRVALLPLVSVAVVTYNQRAFLVECLESILQQDYPNIEIVVADDASTDGTQDLLREYAASGRGRFVLRFAPVNGGITVNQNLAHSGCSGKYISWIAGDDLMLPGKLSAQVDFLENNSDYAICFHDLEVFDSPTGKTIHLRSKIDKPRTGDLRTVIRYGCFNGAVSNMVRAECQPSPAFDKRIPIASDWLYWIECLWSGGKIGYIPEVLGRYRRHDKNITSSNVRQPSLREIQDHLFSCDIVLSRAPHLYREVSARKAALLLSLRWYSNGRQYREYLLASLSYKWRWKIVLGLIADVLGWRR